MARRVVAMHKSVPEVAGATVASGRKWSKERVALEPHA